MHRMLTQPEIDTLVDVLNTLKDYGNTDYVSDDILKGQIVLSQPEIDKLIDTLNNAGVAPIGRSDHNVVLSQDEIDRLAYCGRTAIHQPLDGCRLGETCDCRNCGDENKLLHFFSSFC